MSSVTLRAEQALLGALLTQQQNEHTAAMRLLQSQDFGQRLHRQVFTAIHDLHTAEPDLSGPRLIEAVAARTGINPQPIQALADSAPDPAHASAYAQMIQVAAFRREVADISQALAQSMATRPPTTADIDPSITATGAYRTMERTTAALPGDSAQSTASAEDLHQARLLAALQRQVEVYSTLANTPDTTLTATGTTGPETTPSDPAAPREIAPATQQEQFTPDIGADGSGRSVQERAQLEDLLLADLLRNPDQSDALATFVADSTFTNGQRREIYQTILTTAHAGQPIDDVIIAWQVELLRAGNKLSNSQSTHAAPPEPPAIPGYTPGTGPEPDLVYLTRLAATDSPRTAIEIGRSLVTDDMTALLRENVTRMAHQATPQAQPGARQRNLQRGPQRTAAPQPVTRPVPAPLNPSLTPPDPAPTNSPRPTPRTDR
ncbi:DnaB-like helicase N-terminal domain-containing protein [Kineosporia sp. NBRC 101731]|uniref:DnaB-like helicase N-terminal domain-containing protein n=1 Tax=Kineosporia sp. NBRC 101731 TaxID=3032199 RepID=UPI0024A1BC01|nr:DnaB-like helicase N-terminal domain-containing protein [Kineosporia sp. NBRC 101731]GLY33404.1 hypothetical protein Kisp02_67690 [Kineosporia sp. NBRC 101731]